MKSKQSKQILEKSKKLAKTKTEDELFSIIGLLMRIDELSEIIEKQENQISEMTAEIFVLETMMKRPYLAKKNGIKE